MVDSGRRADARDRPGPHDPRRPGGAVASPSTTRTSRSCATSATAAAARRRPTCSFMDIAATVNPATVHFRSLTEPSRVSVLEQNYEYDLLEPDKLLRKYVGREVTLVRTRAGERHDAAGGGEGAAPQLQQRARSGRSATRSSPACSADHIRFPGAARQSLQPPDAHLDARERRRRARTASRRRIWPASCRGTPTTC